MDRRRVLVASATAILTATAGCTGSVPLLDDGPEETVEAYLEALDDGDADAANEYIHEESLSEVQDDEVGDDITIHAIEERSLESVVEENSDLEGEELASELATVEADVADIESELGADDTAHVYVDMESDEYGEAETFIFLVEDDGEWLIFQ